MKTRISALLDGELEDHEIEQALHELHRDGALRSQWCDWQLIGAAVRGERGLDIDVAARVLSALDLEPTVMVPARKGQFEWRRPALALAASAAGVAVVAWLALASGGDTPPTATMALARVGSAPATAQARPAPRLQEYLVAHQAYAPGGAMVAGARNIRTVAASSEGR